MIGSDLFLFSVEDESGQLHEMDGSGEVCGFVLGREIQENLPDLRYGVQKDLGSWSRDWEASILMVRYGFCWTPSVIK